ncbi:hypothetical protein T08_5603 [Trichinella sp. T8]|nr:hypothetical protein T08_5603 [Trichinella sp. T8]
MRNSTTTSRRSSYAGYNGSSAELKTTSSDRYTSVKFRYPFARPSSAVDGPNSSTPTHDSHNGSFERLESLFEKFLQCCDQPTDDHRHPRNSRSPTSHRRRWLSPTRSGRRSPSLSNQDQRPPTCFCYRRFGDRAQKCAPPCSLLPATESQKQPAQPASNKPILQAVNGTPVSHLGKKTITVQLPNLPALTWTFIVAEVGVTIIGADFFHITP